MWVGLQISVEKKCIFGKKSVGPENVEEKTCHFWKKFVGGYQITPGTNFRHTFRKFLADPLPPVWAFSDLPLRAETCDCFLDEFPDIS